MTVLKGESWPTRRRILNIVTLRAPSCIPPNARIRRDPTEKPKNAVLASVFFAAEVLLSSLPRLRRPAFETGLMSGLWPI